MKKLYLVLFLIFLLAFSGCASKKKQETSLGAFLGGTEGMSFLFVEEEPPETILDNSNQPFFITLQLKNEGEYSIKENEILTTLSGISYESFSITKASQRNQNSLEKGYLNKQTGEIIEGATDQISYEADYQEDLAYDLPFTISANVCYAYQTQAVAQLCLSKQPTRRPQKTDVCAITEEKEVGNSGAPVQITSFSQRAAGQNEVSVTFKVENNNKGETYNPNFINNIQDCVSDDREKNKVYIKVASEQAIDISCPKLGGGKEGEVRLINDQTTVTCNIDTQGLAEATPFAGVMDILVDYTYKDNIATDLTVENAL